MTSFPASLAPYRAAIESTARSTALFRRTIQPTEPAESKMGGAPYFPADANPDVPKGKPPRDMRWTPWPKHRETGQELQLLLQVDFSDVPVLPDFPSAGLLQVFVDSEDWHELGRSMRTVFHPTSDAPAFDFSDVDLDRFRVTESSLSFESEREYVTFSDHRFHQLYAAPAFGGMSFRDRERAEGPDFARDYIRLTDVRHASADVVGWGRNKLGGYHYSQNWKDPRAGRAGWEDAVLLAQFGDYDELSWGDCGSAQLFIRQEDLRARSFDELLFHWDST